MEKPIVLLPLPFFTGLVMRSFAQQFDIPSVQLSLERAKILDLNSMVSLQFRENLYRQPVLAEGIAEPLPYRRQRTSATPVNPPTACKGLGVFHDDAGKVC